MGHSKHEQMSRSMAYKILPQKKQNIMDKIDIKTERQCENSSPPHNIVLGSGMGKGYKYYFHISQQMRFDISCETSVNKAD